MGLVGPGATICSAPCGGHRIGGTCDYEASYMHLVVLYSLSCNIFSMGCVGSGAATSCAPCPCQTHEAFARLTGSPIGIETKGTEVVQCLRHCHADVGPMGIGNPLRIVRCQPGRMLAFCMHAGPRIPSITEEGIRQLGSRRVEEVLEGADLHSIQ